MARKTQAHSHKYLHMIIISLSVLTIVAGYLFWIAQSNANEAKLAFQKEVAKKQCDTTGNPVINVDQKITQDADSGEAGNYWAFDTFARHIQVWKQKDNSFCALVDYDGQFDAVAGQQSPGNTAVLTGDEDGTIKGGYRAIITGTMKATPDLPVKGSLGTTNYACDISGNCPGAFDWTTKYFNTNATTFSFNFAWWGWVYHAKGNHVWINASDGNSGDVL